MNEFIHNIWLSAEYAIDKCDTEDQRKIVKALAVILIVNKEDEIPATEKYLKLCINASDPEQALMELKKKEFIYKKIQRIHMYLKHVLVLSLKQK